MRTNLPPRYADAALLHPERAIVPFDRERRREDLRAIKDWCADRSQGELAWRLLTGDSGRGKTRLMMQVIADLTTDGGQIWEAGFLDLPAFRRSPEHALYFADLPGDLLVVIDYAERFRDVVVAMGQATLAMHERHPDRRIRLLLISRRESDVWTDIRRDDREFGEFVDGGGLTIQALTAMASDEAARLDILLDACQAFQPYVDSDTNNARELTKQDLSAPEFADVMMIHAAALEVCRSGGTMQTLERDKILDAILDREQRLWNDAIRDRPELTNTLCDAPIEQAAAYLTLVSLSEGVASRDRAIALLRDCPRLSHVDGPTLGRIAEILHELYPGPDWVNGVTPDLIGTYLLARSDDELILDAYGRTD